MDAVHPLFHILTLQEIPWAQVDEQAQILVAGPQTCAPLTQGVLPLPPEAPWPPPFPAEGGLARFALADGGVWLAWPLEDGSYLVLPHRYWPTRLEEVQAQRPKFISVVTHELRLPLTAIQGYTDLLLKGLGGEVSPQQRQFLETIRNNVQRMAVLLERLSDMGKLESGRLQVQRQPVRLSEVLTQVALRYGPLCAAKGQTLQVEVPDDLPPAQGDPQRLEQVFEALVDNAHRYTPQGGHITLGARPTPTEIQVWVQDTGVGITPQDRERLFQPFFRSEAAAVREHPGWGLSLHVAGLLVQRMGGRITVETAPGQGSTFTVHLPLAQGQLDEKP